VVLVGILDIPYVWLNTPSVRGMDIYIKKISQGGAMPLFRLPFVLDQKSPGFS